MNPFLNNNRVTDEDLMDKYQKGEYMAFEALYQRHQKTVFSYLNKRLSDEQSKNEVFQNIFLKLHRNRDKYDSNHPFLKWLYVISRSELYDFYKKKKLDTVMFDENIITTSETITPDVDLESVKNLTSKERTAIDLKYFSDKDYSEIAKALETSRVNARKLVSRALKKIKISLTGGQNGKKSI